MSTGNFLTTSTLEGSTGPGRRKRKMLVKSIVHTPHYLKADLGLVLEPYLALSQSTPHHVKAQW